VSNIVILCVEYYCGFKWLKQKEIIRKYMKNGKRGGRIEVFVPWIRM